MVGREATALGLNDGHSTQLVVRGVAKFINATAAQSDDVSMLQ